VKVLDLVGAALLEIGAYDTTDAVTPEDAQFAMTKANQLLTTWATKGIYVYSTTYQPYTLTPNRSPHTIGPSTADFIWPVRPVKIESATNVLGGVESRINVRDGDWWSGNLTKGITSSLSTDLYYSPDAPNGSIFFWPVCSVAQAIKLEIWSVLQQFASLDDTLTIPDAYQVALTLTLAETLCGPFGQQISASLMAQAKDARNAIQANNDQSPRISAIEAGLPRARKGYWNYTTGMRV
jgi:hypothetical protein